MRIKKLLGFLIIIFGLFITIFLAKGETIFEIIAGPGQDPKNIQITNITDTSFSLSYITEGKVIGTLKYGKTQDSLDKIALDDRDQLNQSVNSYKTHSITVRDLEANTAYYFSITSGDEEFLNNSKFFEVETGNLIELNPSFQKPISGRVITSSGQAPEEGLVFVNINGAAKLSTQLKNNGTYVIPLNNLRDESLNNSFKINENTTINIEVISEKLFSSVNVFPNQISPVPVIILSDNHNFSSQNLTSAIQKLPNDENVSPSIIKIKSNESYSPTLSLPLTTPLPSPTKNSSVIITSVNGILSLITGIFSFLSN